MGQSAELMLDDHDLWERYREHDDQSAREDLILRYLGLVEQMGRLVKKRLPPQVRLEDLTGSGTLGLIDAVERYDPGRGVRFESYARTRIRGAIMDGLREQDWLPVTLRRRATELEDTWSRLTQEFGRTPTTLEVARSLGLSLSDLASVQHQTSIATPLSLDEPCSDSDGEDRGRMIDAVPDKKAPDPLARAILEIEVIMLVEALDILSEREQRVIDGCYYQDLTRKEVAESLHLSVARVSQIHTRAISRLRQHLIHA